MDSGNVERIGCSLAGAGELCRRGLEFLLLVKYWPTAAAASRTAAAPAGGDHAHALP